MSDFIHRYETKIEFSKIGRDLSLDFVKGLCILLVLLHHTTGEAFHEKSLFYVWGYPAVPLFLLIQVFQSYKNGYEARPWGLLKIWQRAVMPFLIVEVLITACYLIFNPNLSWRQYLLGASYWGGTGPGSYYPWIYIQFALLLPLLRPLFRYIRGSWLTIIFLLLAVGGEVTCSVVQMPEWMYRLLFIRYVFLIYLGYLLVEKGVVLNIITLTLSVVSLIVLYHLEIKEVDWSPWFYDSKGWRAFHWICYFYIAYPMLYILCKVFYRLPVNGFLENTICALGSHSYAIYIFQLFYFSIIAPYIGEKLLLLGNPVLENVLFILLSILLCSVPVIRFVRGVSNNVILGKLLVIIFLIVGLVLWVVWEWRPYYRPSEVFNTYEVTKHDDDTLRVIMIGDSWVYFHETLRRDSTLELKIKKEIGHKRVKLLAKGKGGAVSGEIYNYMSAERMLATEYDLNNCSQPIIEQGADYCIISAGINDARQRRGKQYYVANYYHIIRFLLSKGIRPVVMEIPEVEVDEAYEGNTLYYQLRSRIVMRMMETNLYGTHDYRQALKDSLTVHHLMDSIVYIPATSWNPNGWLDKRDIYTDDHFHLNLKGYELLDSTFATEIVKDYRLRKNR